MRKLLEGIGFIATWLALRMGRLSVRIFPRRFLIAITRAAADTGFLLFRSFRKRSMKNLTLALGEQLDPKETARIVQGSLRNFFCAFVETAFVLEASAEQTRDEIALHGREHLESALAKGKGAIALGAHLGNFFLVGTRLAAEGYSTHVLVNQPRDGRLSRLFDSYRLQIGQKTIRARPRREASHELVQVLRRNEVAVVIADEFRSGNGIHVPFFGRAVLARRGPATLALRTGAAVLPVYLVRDFKGRLNLIIEPEIELLRSERSKANVKENTLRMTQWLERTVRSYPDQWNWMNIRWQQNTSGALLREEPRYQGFA